MRSSCDNVCHLFLSSAKSLKKNEFSTEEYSIDSFAVYIKSSISNFSKFQVQAIVGSIVWAYHRLKKPRIREMSARSALHSVCPQLSFFSFQRPSLYGATSVLTRRSSSRSSTRSAEDRGVSSIDDYFRQRSSETESILEEAALLCQASYMAMEED